MVLFEPLREVPPLPRSEVDIGRAVVVGRRWVRARWIGVAAFVAAVAFLVPVLGPPAGVRLEPGSTRPAEEFDPLARVVTVAGERDLRPAGYTTARRWQQLTLTSGGDEFAFVTVYAPGQPFPNAPATGEPAETVGGRPAYWVDRGAGEVLAWQWAYGAWAHVAHQPGDRDAMRRIALAVRVGAGERVALPFTLPRPAPYRLAGTAVSLRPAGDPFVRTGLLLAEQDPADPDLQYPHLWVSVENGEKMAARYGANRTVAGRPAMVQDGEVIVFGGQSEAGFAVDVEGTADIDTLVRVAESVRLVPDPDDRSLWTNSPLD